MSNEILDLVKMRAWAENGTIAFNLALMAEKVPAKIGTLCKVMNGTHHPSPTMAERINWVMETFPDGFKGPHPLIQEILKSHGFGVKK